MVEMNYYATNLNEKITKKRAFMLIRNGKRALTIIFLLFATSMNSVSKVQNVEFSQVQGENSGLASSDPKEAVFVIGAPRSGTSCIAGVLEILGVDFGANLYVADRFNEKGYFEDKFLHVINNMILADAGTSTLYPRIIDWSQQTKKEYYKDMAKCIFQQFKGKSFGIKYPDASYALPIYIESMQELGYVPKLVIVLRNPDEIAKSWSRRWGISELETYAVISKVYLNIIRDTHGYDTLVIYYDDMLNDTENVVRHITHFISGLKTYDEAKTELSTFIDGSLKHFTA